MTLLLLQPMMSPNCVAQEPLLKAKTFRDRVVDKVTLADGTQLWGVITGAKPTRLFVSVGWTRSQQPEFYEKRIVPELKNLIGSAHTELAAKLQQDIDQLDPATPEDRQRVGLLNEIQERLQSEEANEPHFLMLEVPKSEVRNLDAQPERRRELARLAILNGLQEIEEAHWKSISQQLQAIPEASRIWNAPPTEDVELSRRKILAAVDVQTNNAARLIRNGQTVIDESAKMDMSAIVNSMLGGNVQSLLNELLNEGTAPPQNVGTADETLPEEARSMAESKKQSTVVLSGFDFAIEAGTATVTRRLFHQSDDGTWKMLLSSSGSAASDDVEPAQVEAIENDPQIKEISGLVEGLGLGGQQFTNALRMGAVVQNAMRKAQQGFDEKVQAIIATQNLTQATEPPLIKLAGPSVPDRTKR